MKSSYFYILLFCLLFSSCQEHIKNSNQQLTLAAYADLVDPAYAVKSHKIRTKIDSMVRNDTDALQADLQTKKYYRRKGQLLWIDRLGVDARADTLLSYLKTVTEMGFSTRRFRVGQIEQDLQAVRNLDVNSNKNISTLLARLEYNLTKGYLRYVAGQRFGYLDRKSVV